MTFVDYKLNSYLGKSVLNEVALEQVTKDLETYFNQPIDKIAQEYWASPSSPSEMTPEALEQFYKTSSRYIYESTFTEPYIDHQRMQRILLKGVRRWDLAPVLDFGGGGGGLSFFLNSQGIACEYADVPGRLSEYAKWRFDRHGLKIPIHDATCALPENYFGVVFLIDVLEHVEDLVGVLRSAKASLRTKGWIIATQSFSPGDPLHLEQHFKYNDLKVFNALLHQEGFDFLGRIKSDPLTQELYKRLNLFYVWGVRQSLGTKSGGNLIAYQRRV